ncbi:MAG: ATP-binding cassette domain-containing protein [Halieaceae bacterium]
MIELRDLQFHYPQSSFSLQLKHTRVENQEHVALIGPSGCGKTTLLNLLAGVLLPDAGSVEVAGESVAALADAQRRDFRIRSLGLVFQNFELLDYLNIRDNILLPLRIGRDLSVTATMQQRVDSMAGRLGISDKLDRHPAQLSQGERQRVAVARALLLEPPLILADEPTGNLDPANKFVVLDLLLDYAREHGATLLAVTHDHDLLDRFDRVMDFNELNMWRAA